ncbi:hypothetical protein OHB53_09525 [Streptomyces sp. NBC_00056]|uniref:hypothetical protein n=1 Tax=Streptomyces sp. NBC_00056 TaxID=2975633 RepID=UPI003252C403
MTTPHERLAAEEIPTGTFGHALPTRPAERPTRPGPAWTPEEQAEHCTELLAALDGWDWDQEARATERRHLRLITDETHTDAA